MTRCATPLGEINASGDWVAEVRRYLVDPVESVMDIGCGIRPQPYILAKGTHYLVDPHGPYLDRAAADWPHGTQPRCWTIIADWRRAVEITAPDSVDIVFLLDVIEHLPKEEGRELLERTIPIARKQVVVFSPLGLLPQAALEGSDQWGFSTGANALQAHRSGWTPFDLDERWGFLLSREFHRHDHAQNALPCGPFDAWWGILTK